MKQEAQHERFRTESLILVSEDSGLPPDMAPFLDIIRKYPEERFCIYNADQFPPMLIARSRRTTIFRCAKCKSLDGPLQCQVCHEGNIEVFTLTKEGQHEQDRNGK